MFNTIATKTTVRVKIITGSLVSESVKCRFSKCRFSAEIEKLEKIFKMGGGVEK